MKNKFPNCRPVKYPKQKGIGWNENGFWFIIDISKSNRTYYSKDQLDVFIKNQVFDIETEVSKDIQSYIQSEFITVKPILININKI